MTAPSALTETYRYDRTAAAAATRKLHRDLAAVAMTGETVEKRHGAYHVKSLRQVDIVYDDYNGYLWVEYRSAQVLAIDPNASQIKVNPFAFPIWTSIVFPSQPTALAAS